MILFTIVLTFLLEAQRNGRMQLLWWLPLIFVLWANIHIQFIYGLFVVGLFMGLNVVQRLASRVGIEPDFVQAPTLPLSGLIGVLIACFAATFIGPYTYHLYHVVAAYSNSHVPYFMIQELSAFNFKFFTHYVLLLLTTVAFFAVGWPKKLDLFKLSSLPSAPSATHGFWAFAPLPMLPILPASASGETRSGKAHSGQARPGKASPQPF
jgi:hypothetical protein